SLPARSSNRGIMTTSRRRSRARAPRVLLVSNASVDARMLRQSDVDRLRAFADFDWLECDVPFDRTVWTTVPDDLAATSLVASRNAGELFRGMAAGDWPRPMRDAKPGFERFELTGKRVGLIGLGIIGRRFVQLLEPFRCEVGAHDPLRGEGGRGRARRAAD